MLKVILFFFSIRYCWSEFVSLSMDLDGKWAVVILSFLLVLNFSVQNAECPCIITNLFMYPPVPGISTRGRVGPAPPPPPRVLSPGQEIKLLLSHPVQIDDIRTGIYGAFCYEME